jgi:hypothetical protein
MKHEEVERAERQLECIFGVISLAEAHPLVNCQRTMDAAKGGVGPVSGSYAPLAAVANLRPERPLLRKMVLRRRRLVKGIEHVILDIQTMRHDRLDPINLPERLADHGVQCLPCEAGRLGPRGVESLPVLDSRLGEPMAKAVLTGPVAERPVAVDFPQLGFIGDVAEAARCELQGQCSWGGCVGENGLDYLVGEMGEADPIHARRDFHRIFGWGLANDTPY